MSGRQCAWATFAFPSMRTFSACVDGQPTETRLDGGQWQCTSTEYNITWVDIPVALVLNAIVATDPAGTHLTVTCLAPRERAYRASILGHVWRRYPYTQHRLSADAWRARDHVPALELVTAKFTLRADRTAEAEEWARTLLQHAYPATKPARHLLILCNPFSGQGCGKAALARHIEPILQAAGCTYEAILLQGRYDAMHRLLAMDLAPFDALVMMGGDGTMHEVVNGLAGRPDAVDALRLPIAAVPSGSGNAIYVNLHGCGNGFPIPLACLTAVKGQAHTQELMVVTQSAALFDGELAYPLVFESAAGSYVQYYSFLSHAIGIMAEVDAKTDAFRLVGDIRFTAGYILGVLLNRRCDVDIDVVLGQHGALGRAAMRARRDSVRPPCKDVRALVYGSVLAAMEKEPEALALDAGDTVPDHIEVPPTQAPWHTILTPISSLYGGKLPFVGRPLMAFPYAMPTDGAIDILIQNQLASPLEKLLSVQHGQNGDHVLEKSIHYFKAEALRVTPRDQGQGTRYLSIDGEMLPYGAFQVEITPLALQLLSLSDTEWTAPVLRTPTVRAHQRPVAR